MSRKVAPDNPPQNAATPSRPPSSRHSPEPLSVPPDVSIYEILRAAQDQPVVFYMGAGLSIAHPSCGPKGTQVADKLRPFVAELVNARTTDVTEPDLESLAARVAREAPGRMADFKVRASEAAEFRTMEPNYGHQAVALLMREGVITGVSVNWDRGIENAARRIDLEIEAVASQQERLQPRQALRLYKVHGCAKRPQTLAVTKAEVDAPQGWAKAEVARAVAAGMVVFLGLGTVGMYVTEPIKDIVELWALDGATVRVVDLFGVSDAWKKTLGEAAADVEIVMGADAFLDDLLRALVADALSRTGAAVRELVDEAEWTKRMLAGFETVRAAFEQAPANGILRWWRDGVTSDQDGRAFVLDERGRETLMAVSLMASHDGGTVHVTGGEEHLTVRSEYRYLEIASMPELTFADIDRKVRERVRRGRNVGRLRPGLSVAAVVHGGRGSFPSPSAPPDIAAEDVAVGDVGSETVGDVRLVRAEDAVAGALAA
ncbi:hypothetical protein OJ997_22885 [Solirubrobacter phytolaccae]|uniref:SIR2-like domain-containing protein n=1 Tax=Solirubrobacter phytolaccae TaxID=1404360 RepID=A0A9X3NDG4_9ACTN|nr:hypothetical protein [Solirubrobacter phytolaccae]MDA0183174.1 hypothetical protein [Solirubrobacter phytolaccae]